MFEAVLAWTGPSDPAGSAGPGILVPPPSAQPVPPLLEAVDAAGSSLGLKAHAILSLRLRAEDDRDALRQIERRYGYDRRRAERAEEAGLAAIDGMTGCLGPVRDGLAALRESLPGPPCSLVAQPWADGLGKAAARRIAQRYGGLFVVGDGGEGEILVPFDPAVWAKALAALATEPEPLSEATRGRIAASLGLDALSEAACRKALLLPAEKAPFASRSDVPRVDPDSMPPGDSRAVAQRAGAVIANHKVSTPLTTRAILSAVRRGLPVLADGLDEAGLERLMLREGLGPHRFRGGWLPPSLQRRPVPKHGAIEDLLVANGAPMALDEIRRRLGDAAVRRRHGVTWLKGRLVELGGGMVGLVDRDLPIDACECREVVEAAHQLLAGGGFATVAILRRTLSDRPYAARLPGKGALASLLDVHGGISVGSFGVLRGKVRPEPAPRGSVVNTVRKVLAEHPRGIAEEALLEEAARRLGRKPKPDILSAAFRRFGRRDAARPGVWHLRGPDASKILPSSVLSASHTETKRLHAYPTVRKDPPVRARAYSWTPDRVAILRKVLGEGGGSREVIEALGGGVTRSAVIGKAHRIGITVGN